MAAVSSGDESIGQMLSEVMSTAGKGGVVSVAEAQGLRLEQDYVDGMQLDRDYISSYMISSYMVTNAERMEAVLENPYILITDKKISAIADILLWPDPAPAQCPTPAHTTRTPRSKRNAHQRLERFLRRAGS